MATAQTSHSDFSQLTASRVSILLVSSSASAAQRFREMAGNSGRLIVNVPDLTGATAVIHKLRPALIICDTEIEGEGSWRDLVDAGHLMGGAALLVLSPDSDEALWNEVLNRGGMYVLAKPLQEDEVDRVLSIALAGG